VLLLTNSCDSVRANFSEASNISLLCNYDINDIGCLVQGLDDIFINHLQTFGSIRVEKSFVSDFLFFFLVLHEGVLS